MQKRGCPIFYRPVLKQAVSPLLYCGRLGRARARGQKFQTRIDIIYNMTMTLRKALFAVLYSCLALIGPKPLFAVLYTADGGAFTIDLPSSWRQGNALSQNAVMDLRREKSSLLITRVAECKEDSCLEAEVNKEVAAMLSKKYKILENSYTGQVVRKTEFSTADPLMSFNYSARGSDFTTGFFLANGKAYKVQFSNLPYVEADLILSFIAPAPKPTNPQDGAEPIFDKGDPAVNDIVAGAVPPPQDEASQNAPLIVETPQSIKEKENAEQDTAGEEKQAKPQGPSAVKEIKKVFAATPFGNKNLRMPALVSAALFFYFMLLVITLALAIMRPPYGNNIPKNPLSYYPLRGWRLYGSPDLFLSLRDNQGNHYIATSGRWSDIFMGFGLCAAVLFGFLHFTINAANLEGTIKMHKVIANTFMSVSSLFAVLGFVVFVTGALLNAIMASKFHFFDKTGKAVYKCIEKGSKILKEEYAVIDAQHSILFHIRRKRFSLKRHWTIYNKQQIIAVITEKSTGRALARMLLGHLFGFLRASYIVEGQRESRGEIFFNKAITTRFSVAMDKPEAVDFRVMLIASSVILMRDRDKWHPWFN